MSYRKGSKVWLEDKDSAWVEAEVIDVKDKSVVVLLPLQRKKITVAADKILPRDTDDDLGGVDDMTKLAYLNEPGVLYNLSRRYALNEIYTYTGSILIAVNPFTKLSHLYNGHMMEQYKGARLGELSPHVYAVADASYRAMMREKCSQSILVSGESGAGKTETTKLIMQYLTHVGGRAAMDDRTVEQQVLESNPLLEAFGNAKTIRNDNSSRFGKFVEIQFDASGRISGAAVRTYLLERSRVVKITYPERNYHCFYQLCASGKDAEKYKLGHPSCFHYLNQSKLYELEGVTNSEEYLKTRKAMDIVGISLGCQEAIFRTLAAILHLGNIEFSPGKEHDSSTYKDSKSYFHLQTAADLFMCNPDLLLSTLCTRGIQTHEGNIVKALDCAAAVANRDALAKAVYARIFDWLVENINKSVGQDLSSKLQIGVLDIYGFECFKNNSFEQFCINFANEKLQQHFNEHVFKMEQEEYRNEEINWSYIEFIDNQDVLDLIEKKPIGIISLLDEACMFPKSTHQTFSAKLFQNLGSHSRLEKEKFSETDFIIAHYAGKVTYRTDFFLEKNRDYIVVEHCNLLSSSRCSFVSGLFDSLSEESSRSSYKFSSVALRFKQQLQALMETLSLTEPHYIRCIKPNSLNRPQKFENQSVLHQLRCGGVLEAVRISLAGYPTRRFYSEFIDRFGILAPEFLYGSYDEKEVTSGILKMLKLANFQLGKSKIFLRAGQIAVLDAQRNEVLENAAKIIQNCFRTFVSHREFVVTRVAAIAVQAYCRGCLARNFFSCRRQLEAAVFIQKNVRRWLLRRAFMYVHSAAVVLQSSIRGFLGLQKYMYIKEHKAAIHIQVWWRMLKKHINFQKYRRAVVCIQGAWRCKLAKRELRKLKLAANESGALREAKSKLEKKLEDLMWRLALEKKLRIASEESKLAEVSKHHETLKLREADLETIRSAFNIESNKNLLLQNKLDHTLKELESFKIDLNVIVELKKENLYLKGSFDSLQERNLELEGELQRAKKYNGNTLEKLHEMEAKCLQLQGNLSKFEEKLISLEDENHILRQKSFSFSPMHNHSGVVNFKSYSEKYSSALVLPRTEDTVETPPSKTIPPLTLSASRRARKIVERHEENHEMLLRCIKEKLGFKDGRPVAACAIYKLLLHWHAFEAEKTTIFDFVIKGINNVLEVDNEEDNLPYWLSNSSSLLCLLQRNLRSKEFLTTPSRRFGSLGLNRRIGVKPISNFIGEENLNLAHIEAQYPAILFKQQLTACLEKIFGLMRDNLKKEILPLLSQCIQAPKSTQGPTIRPSKSPGGVAQPLSNTNWDLIIKFLDSLMERLRENFVPSFFIRKLVIQLFAFINIQLFNSLLLRRECCTFSNGEYVKSGLTLLEKWISDVTEEYAGTSWHELNYIRQAVGFLIIHQKRKKTLEEITQDLCPALSLQQIYRICKMYWDERYGTQSVSSEVVGMMREMVNKDTQNLASNSFLLDDDICIPFSTEDISKAIPAIDPIDIELPQFLQHPPSAHVLQQFELTPA
ncbi:protein OPAQUE1-like [Zingiber officinale]|uniref:protein OPAQUE1-like n=1 Tax=Zingiber officinale TaxID=94328 RepID=UPI001C4D35D4|nr:protein OPAQUE1-like [Zingiber officinale]